MGRGAGRVRFGVIPLVVAAMMPLLVCAGAFAQGSGARVEARIDQTPVFVGQPFHFQIDVTSVQTPETPDLSVVPAGIRVGRMSTGQQTAINILNGRRTTVTTHTFSFEMVVEEAGTYRIPQILVRVAGKAPRTREVRFAAGRPPESDDLRLEIEIDNRTPYVGEPVLLTARLYTTSGMRVPTFVTAGDFEAFDTADVPGWSGNEQAWEFLGGEVRPRSSREVVDGQTVLVVELARRLIPREPGPVRLGPITVSATLLRTVQDGLFRRQRSAGTVSARSEAIDLQVRRVPLEGRPDSFDGLVGMYALHAEADPSEVSVGDPIQMHVLVTGGPLIDDVSPPALGLLSEFDGKLRVSSEAPERQAAAGGVVFTYNIRALDDSVSEIPSVELAYFDPKSGTYGVAKSDPIKLSVRPTRRITASDAVGGVRGSVGSNVGDTQRGIAHNYVGADALVSVPTSVLGEIRSPVWIASIAVPPAMYAACALVVGVRRRGEGRGAVRRRSRALAESTSRLREAASVDDVVSGVSVYFEMATGRRGASLTPRDCEAIVAPISQDGAERLHALLERCDAVRYAGSSERDIRGLSDEARALLGEIDPGMRRARA